MPELEGFEALVGIVSGPIGRRDLEPSRTEEISGSLCDVSAKFGGLEFGLEPGDLGIAVSRFSSREARGLAEEFGGDEKGTLCDGLRFGIERAFPEETKSGLSCEPSRLLGFHRWSDRFEGWRSIAARYGSQVLTSSDLPRVSEGSNWANHGHRPVAAPKPQGEQAVLRGDEREGLTTVLIGEPGGRPMSRATAAARRHDRQRPLCVESSLFHVRRDRVRIGVGDDGAKPAQGEVGVQHHSAIHGGQRGDRPKGCVLLQQRPLALLDVSAECGSARSRASSPTSHCSNFRALSREDPRYLMSRSLASRSFPCSTRMVPPCRWESMARASRSRVGASRETSGSHLSRSSAPSITRQRPRSCPTARAVHRKAAI